ncbi:MAG: PAS domain S-box protein [Nitrospinota bacterium]
MKYKNKEEPLNELAELKQKINNVDALEIEFLRSKGDLLLFKELIDKSSDAIFITDPGTGHFLYVNDRACISLGYTSEELLKIGASDIEMLFPDNFSWKGHVEEVQRMGYMILEGKHRRKDGTTFPVEVNVRFIPIQKKNYLVAIVRDLTERKRIEESLQKNIDEKQQLQYEITERKRMEESLNNYKKRLETIIDSSPDIIFLKDNNLRHLVSNKSHERLFNTKKEDIIGKTDFDFIPKEAAEICRESDEKALKTNSPIVTEETVMGRCFHVIKQRIVDGEGNISGIVGIIHDITERKRMEAELLKAGKLESLGILAGGIAHDFNNLLTGIIGNISLAKMLIRPEDRVYQILTEGEKASLRAKDLTQQLLTFARGGEPLKKTVYINKMIKDSVSLSLSGSNIRCEFSIQDGLLPVGVDEGQIRQVINNIVINARESMPESGVINIGAENITIHEKDNPTLKSGRYVRVYIQDMGIGISKELLDKIFDPYFTTKQKGRGLGLAAAYSIIKRHDGLIKVESELGIGTTFNIYLPASNPLSPPLAKGNEGGLEKHVAGKGRVLVMDDEEMIGNLTREILSDTGYEVDLCRDGEEAIDVYRKAKESGRPFDAVIMDLTIPRGMGGGEAIKRLLKIDPDVRVIVSSGYSSDPIMSDYKTYGFKGVIAKPYDVQELSRIVSDVISIKA